MASTNSVGNLATGTYGGMLSPHLAVGPATITGDYTAGATAVLAMKIAGGDTFDHLTITGHAQLAGSLLVSVLDTYAPTVGDTFDLLDLANASGQFDTIQLLGLPAGWTLDRSRLYADGTVALTPEPAGLLPAIILSAAFTSRRW